MVASFVNSFSPSVSNGSGVQHWSEVVAGGTLHTYIAINAATGSVIWVATALVPSGPGAMASQGTLTTVGAGTLTAALLLNTDILRSGPTGAFTDTTDTAANLQTAWTGAGLGSSFVLTYQNTTAFAATISAGLGVTISGNAIVPANTWSRYLVVWTGANTVTFYNIEAGQIAPLPYAQYTTSSVTTGSIAAGVITGAQFCVWLQSGATPGNQLVRTAAQMLADTPNGRVGMSTVFRVINTGSGTLTIAADGGATVTITGTATVAQNTWRDFVLTFTSATTATVQSIGVGTQS